MSISTGRGRGSASRYYSGNGSKLTNAPAGRKENLERDGEWSYEQLIRMDANFRKRLERAFARGLEHSPQRDERAA